MKKFTVKDMAEIGVLAALVFVATYFLKIGPIPTPAGNTMLKTGNAVCLLGGIMFGKVKGGLAAGIGSMFYDLLDPIYVASAPFTGVFFFVMGFVTGWISHLGGKNGNNLKQNIIAGSVGSLAYIVLYISKSVIKLMLEGSAFIPAITASGTKLFFAVINAVFAVAVSSMLAPVFIKAIRMDKK